MAFGREAVIWEGSYSSGGSSSSDGIQGFRGSAGLMPRLMHFFVLT